MNYDSRGFRKNCWNCGSGNFQETLSREYCPDCKLELSYSSGYRNEAYDRALENKYRREDYEREKREQEEYDSYPV